MIGDTALYVWGSYVMVLALTLVELVLLRLRDRSIRRHLGWIHRHRRAAAAPESDAAPSRGATTN